MDDEAFAAASYDETLAREIVNECAATARAGVERGRGRGGARGGARCDEASERAVSEEEPGRGLIHARRRSVMKTY